MPCEILSGLLWGEGTAHAPQAPQGFSAGFSGGSSRHSGDTLRDSLGWALQGDILCEILGSFCENRQYRRIALELPVSINSTVASEDQSSEIV